MYCNNRNHLAWNTMAPVTNQQKSVGMEHYSTCYQSTGITWHGTLFPFSFMVESSPVETNTGYGIFWFKFIYNNGQHCSRLDSTRLDSTRLAINEHGIWHMLPINRNHLAWNNIACFFSEFLSHYHCNYVYWKKPIVRMSLLITLNSCPVCVDIWYFQPFLL